MSKELRLSICAYNTARFRGAPAEPGLQRVKHAMSLAEIAKNVGSKLAVFPEICAIVGTKTADYAEPLDGPCFCEVAKTAKNLNMYIAFNHPSLEDGKKYNTTVLFNPTGDIEGLYHKTYLTIWEMEDGFTAGAGPVVLETSIAKIGFITCYDLNFEELRRQYANLEPELMLFPSYFRGGLQSVWWAYQTRSYFVSSVIDPGSIVVSPVGRTIGEIDCLDSILTTTIELDYKVLHFDYNNFKIDELRNKYGHQIEIEHAEAEGIFLLSAKGDKSAQQICKELDMECINPYFDRAREIRKENLNGKFPDKGPTAWPKY